MNRDHSPLWGILVALVVLSPLANAHGESSPTKDKSLPRFQGAIAPKDVSPHIEFLASEELRGRSGEGADLAAQYLKEQFQNWGLRPLFGEQYFQRIPGTADENGEKTFVGKNVGAWIPGSDAELRKEFIILSAHYDHLGTRNGKTYRGADDNASGVSMLLEVARQISMLETKPRRSLVFVGFDLEERMLWGSRWFASHSPWPLEQVKLFITADMIGRSLGNLNLPTVFILGSEHGSGLETILDEVGSPLGLETARLGIDLIGTRSDYGPFRDRQIPFLFFSTGEHPDYHTPQDTPERIDYEKVARVSSLILKLCQHVGNCQTCPKWVDEPQTNLDEVRALHRITTLLLDDKESRPLNNVQSLVVSQTQVYTKKILERGQITPQEREWLIHLSRLLLLSVF